MKNTYAGEIEINAVKSLSRFDSDDLKAQILAAHPNDIFGTAKPSNNDNVAYIICPHCGNGSGKDHTPVKCDFKGDRWLYHCFAHQDLEGDLLSIIAQEHNLNLNDRNDMAAALVYGAQLIGYNLDDAIAFSQNLRAKKPSNRPTIRFHDFKPVEDKEPQQFDRLAESYTKLSWLFNTAECILNKNKFRGLTKDTIARLNWGFLTDYKHPNNNFVFQALIIPNDKGGILARQVDGDAKSNISPSATTTICRTTNNNILFIVEGAIDGASIAQATNFNYGVIAIGGTSGIKNCVARLSELYSSKDIKPNIIVLLDNDSNDPNDFEHNPGQDAAHKLVPELKKLGFNVVNKIISTVPRTDPNDILRKEGDSALSSIIDFIVSDAQKHFHNSNNNVHVNSSLFNDQITQWQEFKGNINPALIPKIFDAFNFVETLTNFNFKADFTLDVAVLNKIALLKFYFPQAADKFFTILQNAKAAAQDAMSRLSKEHGEDLITPDLKRLARLSKTQFEKDINSIVANLSKEHKKFVADEKQKAEIDAINAERKSREELNETTAGNVKDCPIDLKIPYNVYFNEQGISIVDYSGRFPKTYQAANTPIVPLKIFREPIKHITQYEIAIRTAKNTWRKIIVDGDELADSKKIIRLAKDGGALIESPSHLTKFFARIIAENIERLLEIKCYQQPGWQDNKFEKFIYPTGGDDYIVRRAGFDYSREFATQGDRDISKKAILDACDKGGATARVFLGFSLSSLLVRPFNISNVQVQLNGKSGSGKTALEKLCASIHGNPRKLIRTFGATLKNRQAVAAAYNDLPTFLDELETVNGGKKGEESLPQMIYEYELGTANQANKRDGSARETFEFFGSRLMTGERPILKNHDQRGTFKRLVQLHIDSLFDDFFSSDLHLISENHFGHFGKEWADFVTVHLNDMRTNYISLTTAALKRNKNCEPTLIKAVSVAALATQYFFVCIGKNQSFDAETFAADANFILSLLPTQDELDDSTRAIADLQSFVVGHDKNFAKNIKDHSAEGFTAIGADAWECFGKKFDNGEIAFLPTALKKILENELGYHSMDALLAEWACKNFLRCTKGRGYRFSTKINGKSIPAIRFKAGVLFSNDEDTDSFEEI